MTGTSLIWKMSPDERRAFIRYTKKPISAVLIAGGASLIMEHLFTFDGFDLLDFWGHEYLGMGMIIVGVLVSMKWGQWKSLNLSNIRNWLR